MKPDIKLFKALKEDSDYFKWEKHTHAMMGGTDMGELIDPSFVPHPDDALSFRNKCRWLYAIFDNLVHTAEGREIIRRHQYTQDGQAVLAELHNTAFSSTASEMKAASLYEELVNTRISTWSGSAIGFITDFITKIEEYNYTVPIPGRRLNNDTKKALLVRAVEGSRGLRDVKIRELHRIAEGHPELDYSRYMYLLRETAKQIDKSKTYQRSRKANVHMGNFDDPEFTGEEDDIGSGDPLLAYMASRVPGSRMSGATWGSLSKETQGIWDQIPDEEKAKILQGISSNIGANNSSGKKRTKFKANKHEISATDDSEDDEDEPSTIGTGEDAQDTEEEEGNRQVNEAKSSGSGNSKSNAHPGDVRRVLGQKGKDGKTAKKGKSFNAMWHIPSGHGEDSDNEGEYSELGQWGAPVIDDDYGELRHGNHPHGDWNPDDYWKNNQFFPTGDW